MCRHRFRQHRRYPQHRRVPRPRAASSPGWPACSVAVPMKPQPVAPPRTRRDRPAPGTPEMHVPAPSRAIATSPAATNPKSPPTPAATAMPARAVQAKAAQTLARQPKHAATSPTTTVGEKGAVGPSLRIHLKPQRLKAPEPTWQEKRCLRTSHQCLSPTPTARFRSRLRRPLKPGCPTQRGRGQGQGRMPLLSKPRNLSMSRNSWISRSLLPTRKVTSTARRVVDVDVAVVAVAVATPMQAMKPSTCPSTIVPTRILRRPVTSSR